MKLLAKQLREFRSVNPARISVLQVGFFRFRKLAGHSFRAHQNETGTNHSGHKREAPARVAIRHPEEQFHRASVDTEGKAKKNCRKPRIDQQSNRQTEPAIVSVRAPCQHPMQGGGSIKEDQEIDNHAHRDRSI
jgi:hypothetical protein